MNDRPQVHAPKPSVSPRRVQPAAHAAGEDDARSRDDERGEEGANETLDKYDLSTLACTD